MEQNKRTLKVVAAQDESVPCETCIHLADCTCTVVQYNDYGAVSKDVDYCSLWEWGSDL